MLERTVDRQIRLRKRLISDSVLPKEAGTTHEQLCRQVEGYPHCLMSSRPDHHPLEEMMHARMLPTGSEGFPPFEGRYE